MQNFEYGVRYPGAMLLPAMNVRICHPRSVFCLMVSFPFYNPITHIAGYHTASQLFLFPSFLIVVCDSPVRKISHFSPFIYSFNHLFISLRTHGYSSADKFLSFLLALQFFDFWEQFAFCYPECLVLDNPAWDGGGDLSFHANLEVSITIMVHSCAVTALDDFFLVLCGACRMRTISL